MQAMLPKVLFVTLRTFSLTGGVEKVCRGISFALRDFEREGKIQFTVASLYDEASDEKYLLGENFKGYGGKRWTGMIQCIKYGLSCDTIILSHINLSPIGLAIKRLRPSVRVIVWTHGIEIWRPLDWVKRSLLKCCNEIIAVSGFTAGEISRMHDTGKKKVRVIPNALDPFFDIPNLSDEKLKRSAEQIRERHGIPSDQKVFMALTRLRITEKNKNYDKVISLLGKLRKEGNECWYMLCGKFDSEEEARIKSIAVKAGMGSHLILTGFVPDEDLSSYYLAADAFVLPSIKEGFGLAFMEAQACGLYVLAGNADGSPEAVRSKEAGILVNPLEDKEIESALSRLLNSLRTVEEREITQKSCLINFKFERLKKNLGDLLNYQ